jgi:hypothetical protein
MQGFIIPRKDGTAVVVICENGSQALVMASNADGKHEQSEVIPLIQQMDDAPFAADIVGKTETKTIVELAKKRIEFLKELADNAIERQRLQEKMDDLKDRIKRHGE